MQLDLGKFFDLFMIHEVNQRLQAVIFGYRLMDDITSRIHIGTIRDTVRSDVPW